METHPVPVGGERPVTDAAWRLVYDLWTTQTLPCYAAHGIDIPGAPPFEVFLAAAEPDIAWNPSVLLFDQADDPSHAMSVSELCPFQPTPADLADANRR